MEPFDRVAELEARNAELEAENTALRARVEELNEQVAVLAGKLADLEKLLGRNSSNSSKPPSSDAGTAKSARPENASRAARRAMARKQGKQPGAPGATLSRVPDPDVVVVHRPVRCRGCDRGLDDAVLVGSSSRQVFDVPDPTVVVTEHRAEKRRCSCGYETAAVFPPEATAPACYGPSIKAHALYLMCAQHLPRERCAMALADLSGWPCRPGRWTTGCAKPPTRSSGSLPSWPISSRRRRSVHADETSVRSGKKALWVHVCATALLTLLHVGRRDRKTVEAGPLGNYTGTIVHDRLAMYFNYGSGHVPCNAHILRSLNELAGNHRHQDWARGFIELIVDTKCRVDAARADDKAALTVYQQRRIRKRWDDLCQQAARAAPPPVAGTQLYGTNKDARLLAVALGEHRHLFLALHPPPHPAVRQQPKGSRARGIRAGSVGHPSAGSRQQASSRRSPLPASAVRPTSLQGRMARCGS